MKLLVDNPDHLQELCSELALGRPESAPQRVFGGLHHWMWRVDAGGNRFAVKQLAADTDLADPRVLSHYQASEAVAEAFSGHGIEVIGALRKGAGYLQLIGDCAYLVYPWTDARARGRDEIEPQHAQQVAAILARMHRANIRVPGLREVPDRVQARENIDFLLYLAREQEAPCRRVLEELRPTLHDIALRQEAAVRQLHSHQVVSHGDLDHKNVLWHANVRACLIDWESARRLNPTHEIVLEALDWSGITGRFNPDLFRRMLATYERAGGEIPADALPLAFHCVLGDWLNWLMYNVGRSLGLDDAVQRRTGADQVDVALSVIQRILHYLPQLLGAAGPGEKSASSAGLSESG